MFRVCGGGGGALKSPVWHLKKPALELAVGSLLLLALQEEVTQKSEGRSRMCSKSVGWMRN